MIIFNEKKIVTNASGMAVATLVQAGIKIFSVPLLLAVYGKHDFGLLVLALSVNLYLQFLSLGVPGALVKFIAASWKEKKHLTKLCRSSNSFFIIIGILNFSILYLFAVYGSKLFGFSEPDTDTLRLLFIVAAFSALVHWPGSFLDSLMTAKEDLIVLSSFRTSKSIFELIGVLLLYKGFFNWSLVEFFIFQFICMHIFLPVKVWRIIHLNYPLRIFIPGLNWGIFKPILYFSSALIVIHIMNATVEHIRPLLLAAQYSDGTSIAADYRILQTIANFALLGAGFLRTSLLPSISKAYASNLYEEANYMVQKASRYGWTLLALPLFIGISLAPELLRIYVGEGYLSLAFPLRIWLIALSVQLYNGPGFAAVMGGGNVKLFAFSVIVSCSVSLLFLCLTTSQLGILAAPLSTLILNVIHMVFLHLLILKSVPKLQVRQLFLRSYLPPMVIGTSAFILSECLLLTFDISDWPRIIIKILLVSLIYITTFLIFFDKQRLKRIIVRAIRGSI